MDWFDDWALTMAVFIPAVGMLIVVTALASFWLGTDVAFGILPLLRAQGYSFKSPLDPGESGALAASRSAQELAQKARIRRI
jgi:hypothetical protein